MFAGCICSQSSTRTGRFGMMSEMASFLDVPKGIDSVDATMRLETRGRREDKKHGPRSTELLTQLVLLPASDD
jgi:hypothetical protein